MKKDSNISNLKNEHNGEVTDRERQVKREHYCTYEELTDVSSCLYDNGRGTTVATVWTGLW